MNFDNFVEVMAAMEEIPNQAVKSHKLKYQMKMKPSESILCNTLSDLSVFACKHVQTDTMLALLRRHTCLSDPQPFELAKDGDQDSTDANHNLGNRKRIHSSHT